MTNKIVELVKSGFAGMLPNGNIVDRRIHPDAIAIQANTLLGVSPPKPTDQKDKKTGEN